jgi:DNA-binding beta-propeller fold protein YncE
LLTLLLALLVFPAHAAAAAPPGSLSQLVAPADCVGEIAEEQAHCATKVPYGLSFAYELQVSPDGASAYSVAVNGDLIEYARNQANGALTVIGCFSALAKTEPACAAQHAEMEVSAIERPAAVAISSDGADVYVVAQAANNVVEFSRNPETGLLTKLGCITHEAASSECATTGAKGLNLPYGVTVSPDGANVYVTGFADDAVAEFKREASGELTQLATPNNCISETSASECGTTTGVGLKEAIGLAVSPDGKDLYVAAGAREKEGDVVALERGAEGALKQLSGTEACISEKVAGCANAEYLQGAEDLVVSPDGQNVYVTSTKTKAVIELQRGASGALAQLASPNECVSLEAFTGCQQAKALGGTVGIAISPDGQNVYTASAGENAVAVFDRGAEGALEQSAEDPCVTEEPSGCEPPSANGLVGLKYARRLTVSPDGTNVYVAAQEDHAIVELARAVTPTVTALSPNQGAYAGETEVTISGTGFSVGDSVKFGSAAATNVQVRSATTIIARSPAGSATADVTVTSSSGTSPVDEADKFAYGRVGGLNLTAYCEGIGDNGKESKGNGPAILIKEGIEGPEFAYGNWACVEDDGTTAPIANHGAAPSMDNACEIAFPGIAAHAGPENPNNAYSWNCYEGAPAAEEPKGGGGSGGEVIAKTSNFAGPITSLAPLIVPPPVLARSGNVAPVSGTVLVRLPGAKTFVALSSLQQIPFGTVIEATHGTVSVTTALPGGGTQTGQFFDGEFILRQGRNGVVVAELTGGNFAVCPTARERSHIARASRISAQVAATQVATAQAAASGSHVVRKLWANAHGKFSTKGNYAAGAVQGTEWLTEDLCDGTLIRVTRDKVAVTNLVNHRRVEVKTGHKYLAKAPR